MIILVLSLQIDHDEINRLLNLHRPNSTVVPWEACVMPSAPHKTPLSPVAGPSHFYTPPPPPPLPPYMMAHNPFHPVVPIADPTSLDQLGTSAVGDAEALDIVHMAWVCE